MRGVLSLSNTPPIAAPLRFFVSAPLFGVLTGLVLVASGEQVFGNRWSTAALACTHLWALGFVLQFMLGALQQLLPVVAQAPLAQPLWLARGVHAALILGSLTLVIAFLAESGWHFGLASMMLAAGLGSFLLVALTALWRAARTSTVARSLGLALVGLGATVALGLHLAGAMATHDALGVLRLRTQLHVGWGLLGWSATLVAAVAVVVVPMFQYTPKFPVWLERHFPATLLGLMALWSAAWIGGQELAALFLLGLSQALVALLALATLRAQAQSRRAHADATGHLWRLGMGAALLAVALWVTGLLWPGLAGEAAWASVLGVLVFVGALGSLITGMVYKIVPFLVWLHLQQLGGVLAPNMKQVLPHGAIHLQAWAHVLAFALLLLAALWPSRWATLGGWALCVAQLLLLRNILHALATLRHHQRRIHAHLRASE